MTYAHNRSQRTETNFKCNAQEVLSLSEPTRVIRSDMVTLHLIQGTSTGRTRVHVHVEWLVVETALVYRLVVVHRHLGSRSTNGDA